MTVEQINLATCIHDTAAQLALEANKAGLATLAYLLEMTALEAAETRSQRQARGRKRMH